MPNVLHIFPFYMAFDICKMFSIYFYVGKRKRHTHFFFHFYPHTHLRKHEGKESDSEWLWLSALRSQLFKWRAKEGERNGYSERQLEGWGGAQSVKCLLYRAEDLSSGFQRPLKFQVQWWITLTLATASQRRVDPWCSTNELQSQWETPSTHKMKATAEMAQRRKHPFFGYENKSLASQNSYNS